MNYRNISISAILHALAIAHRNCFTDSETLVFVSRSCPFAKDEPVERLPLRHAIDG